MARNKLIAKANSQVQFLENLKTSMVTNLESLTDLAQDFADELVFDRSNQDNYTKQRSQSVFKDGKGSGARASMVSIKSGKQEFKQ